MASQSYTISRAKICTCPETLGNKTISTPSRQCCCNHRKAVPLPLGSCDQTNVIKLPTDKPGTYSMGPNKFQLEFPTSQITITPRPGNRRRASPSCINPSECRHIQGNMESNVTAAVRADQLQLHDAWKEVMANSTTGWTLEDVEELLEIHNCNQIQKKLLAYIQDKKNKLRRREACREAALCERKNDLHEELLQRIIQERNQQSRMHDELLTLIDTTRHGHGSRDDVEISISHNASRAKDLSQIKNFQPQTESTRIIPDLKRPEMDTFKISYRPGTECNCSNYNQVTDVSDEPNGTRR